jgi:hypothetical protein
MCWEPHSPMSPSPARATSSKMFRVMRLGKAPTAGWLADRQRLVVGKSNPPRGYGVQDTGAIDVPVHVYPWANITIG